MVSLHPQARDPRHRCPGPLLSAVRLVVVVFPASGAAYRVVGWRGWPRRFLEPEARLSLGPRLPGRCFRRRQVAPAGRFFPDLERRGGLWEGGPGRGGGGGRLPSWEGPGKEVTSRIGPRRAPVLTPRRRRGSEVELAARHLVRVGWRRVRAAAPGARRGRG